MGALPCQLRSSAARWICLLAPTCAAAAAAGAALPHADHLYTHYHPQPLRNWLNDPNGPMYFNGTYHLFFQYNPRNYTWGDMHWYHMASTDLVHWQHLPVALAPDQAYDCGGVFSGSATIVRDDAAGRHLPVLTYSVACGKSIVNAVPSDLEDPNLVSWTKPGFNPVIPVPPGVSGGFRDPTTAWQGKDGFWRLLVGCGNGEGTCQFKSRDFIQWTYVGAFHSHGGGMWECPDFFSIPGTDKYVLKASAGQFDWWALGTYTEQPDPTKPDSFVPLSGDIGERNQKLDFGLFYASKAFLDPVQKRQVLFGWVNYHCDGTDWSGVQTVPRIVEVDPGDSSSIVTYPIAEIEGLRTRTDTAPAFDVQPGSVTDLPFSGSQVDVEITFSVNFSETSSFGVRAFTGPVRKPQGADRWQLGWDLQGGDYEVNSSAALTGPCTADGNCPCQQRCEADGRARCKAWALVPRGHPNPRCSLKARVPRARRGPGLVSGVTDPSDVPSLAAAGQAVALATTPGGVAMLDGQAFAAGGSDLQLRLLVDHSVIEAYAQRGRAVKTYSHCPASAGDLGLQLFNDGPVAVTVRSLAVHQLKTANVVPGAEAELLV